MLRGAVVRGRKNPLYTQFSTRLKKARKACGFSKRTLSDQAGLSNIVAGYLEEGGRVPRLITVERLAALLSVSPAWLAYGLEESPPARDANSVRNLAERLRELRQTQGMSRAALAVCSGVAVGAIQHIETGNASPGIDTVERLAIALGVSPAWLAFGPAAMEAQTMSVALPLGR